MVFAGAYVHACLNNGRHLVAYEADFHIFNAILVHFVHCLLNVLECKHQYNPWSWRRMKNMFKKWLGKLV